MEYTTRTKRSHNRVVYDCYKAMREAEENNDYDKLLKVMERYGKQTREDAIRILEEKSAERLGMSYEEYRNKFMN